MEGLEVSEVRLSECQSDLFRLEAEYYKKEYFALAKMLQDSNTLGLKNVKITCGPFGSNLLDTLYTDKGILVIRPFNLKKCTIETENLVYLSEEDVKANNLKIFNVGTLLFSRVGDIKIGISNQVATISPNIIAVEFSDIQYAKTLAVFFQTHYGYKQIEKHLKVSAQPTISTNIIEQLKIPDFNDKTIVKTSQFLDISFEKLTQSQSLYRQAERLLLETIGFQNFKPSEKGTNIKTFKKSFLTTGRLDAEYYQPKYEEIIAKIKKQPYDELNNLVNIKKSIEPGSDVYSDEGLPFIRVSDYNKFGISTPEKCLSNSFYKENIVLLQSLYPTKGTILFSKDGSVGMAYMMHENMRAVTSGAILHLNVKNHARILPEYLTLVLNSKVVKLQAERDVGGSIILHWRVNEIKEVIIPIVPMKVQQRIVDLINESFSLRRESERLLEKAREMVEREIENS